jgi:diadenosine tetraphosphate (Ap4A) HIT family hydrolase
MLMTKCDLCNEFSGNGPNTFERIYRNNPNSRILFRSNRFIVIPSLGQIAEGHLLLLPINHWTSIGDLGESLLAEFAELSRAVTKGLREQYGSCIAFEHGVRSASAGGCGISHAHLHALPLPQSLDPVDSLKSKFSYKRVADLNELRNESDGMSGYLFYQDTRSIAYVFDAPNLESQYMRKALTAVLGAHDWDWRSAGREERLLATLNRMSNPFDNLRFSVESLANDADR